MYSKLYTFHFFLAFFFRAGSLNLTCAPVYENWVCFIRCCWSSGFSFFFSLFLSLACVHTTKCSSFPFFKRALCCCLITCEIRERERMYCGDFRMEPSFGYMWNVFTRMWNFTNFWSWKLKSGPSGRVYFWLAESLTRPIDIERLPFVWH